MIIIIKLIGARLYTWTGDSWTPGVASAKLYVEREAAFLEARSLGGLILHRDDPAINPPTP